MAAGGSCRDVGEVGEVNVTFASPVVSHVAVGGAGGGAAAASAAAASTSAAPPPPPPVVLGKKIFEIDNVRARASA